MTPRGPHHWDEIRARSTTLDIAEVGTNRIHESVFRASGILEEVKRMLVRGDSVATIATFMEWAEGQEMTQA